jgi:hypothetical protein
MCYSPEDADFSSELYPCPDRANLDVLKCGPGFLVKEIETVLDVELRGNLVKELNRCRSR